MKFGEFDLVIILDACRADCFATHYSAYSVLSRGELRAVFSHAIDTQSFYAALPSKLTREFILVSGHPGLNSVKTWGELNVSSMFKRVVDSWANSWIAELCTSSPERVLRDALKWLDAKLWVHFVQPHAPLPTLRSIPKRSFLTNAMQQFELAAKGEIGVGELQKAYIDNLLWVLPYANILAAKALERGKRVLVTADHGDALGEDGCFGHSFEHPAVRCVPWLEIEPRGGA